MITEQQFKEILKKKQKELKDLKVQMQLSQDFANEIPILKDIIIKNIFTGLKNENFGNRLSNLWLGHDVWRSKYSSMLDKYNKITNYKRNEEYDDYFFSIYINSYTLFNENIKDDLKELNQYCFYYDNLNSTFYVKDSEMEVFIEKLKEWYNKTITDLKEIKRLQKIKELESELSKLNGDKHES